MAALEDSVLVTLCNHLNSYYGRETSLRLIQYSCYLFSEFPLLSGHQKKALETAANKLAETRTVLRLLDDFPMLQFTLQQGLGSPVEADSWLRVLNVLNNVVDQLYYPLEHLSWAVDNKIVISRGNPWSDRACLCWTISLNIHVLKAIRYLVILGRRREQLIESSTSSPFDQDSRSALKDIRRRQRFHALNILQASVDLCNAIHWLPYPWMKSWLWSGSLSAWQIGLLGIVSSCITLYKTSRYPGG